MVIINECIYNYFYEGLPSYIQPNEINFVRSGTDIEHISTARITLVTYNLLLQPALREHVEAQQFKCVVVDESHYLKNRNAKRTKTILPILQKATRVLLLSGTPALARPEELWSQLEGVCPGEFGSFTPFATRYCNAHRGRFGWDTKGSSHLVRLSPSVHACARICRVWWQ